MKKGKYVVGIGCIGSGVGQSVITSCRISKLPLFTIGFGNNPYAFGMYDCDEYEIMPSIYHKEFIEILIKKCVEKQVDVLIPGRDDEVLIYSENEELFKQSGIRVIIPSLKLIKACRDKESLYKNFGELQKLFVKTYSRQEIINLDKMNKVTYPLLAKPRDGFGSKGIYIINSLVDLERTNSNYIVQELAIPIATDPNYEEYIKSISRNINSQVSEISIQLVAAKSGEMIGRMASYNKLNNGVPIEILPFDDPELWQAVELLLPYLHSLGLKGPLNIQGRITENGFKIFEMNPRFTGITGFRAIAGFNEVEACIKSWLDLSVHPITLNMNRFGMRQTLDKTVDLQKNQQIQNSFISINKTLDRQKGHILVTEPCGFLGRHLIPLLDLDKYNLIFLAKDKQETQRIFPDISYKSYDHSDLNNGVFSFGNIDMLIHIGPESGEQTSREIAEDLRNTRNIFNLALFHQVPAIINISTQSVYGLDKPPLWRETDWVSPRTIQAQAKYFSEIILENITCIEPHLKGTSIRLATLSGGSVGFGNNDLIYQLVDQVINNQPIYIQGGQQLLERLDVRDAAQALVMLMGFPTQKWKHIYNLGCNKTYSLNVIVERVIEISKKYHLEYGYKPVIINNDEKASCGMDSSTFINDVEWRPIYGLDDIIKSIFERRIKKEN